MKLIVKDVTTFAELGEKNKDIKIEPSVEYTTVAKYIFKYCVREKWYYTFYSLTVGVLNKINITSSNLSAEKGKEYLEKTLYELFGQRFIREVEKRLNSTDNA